MTLAEFQRNVFDVAMASPICGIPIVRRLTATSINLRVEVTTGGFMDVFYNEETHTTAFALILADRRVFGADNTGGWLDFYRICKPSLALAKTITLF